MAITKTSELISYRITSGDLLCKRVKQELFPKHLCYIQSFWDGCLCSYIRHRVCVRQSALSFLLLIWIIETSSLVQIELNTLIWRTSYISCYYFIVPIICVSFLFRKSTHNCIPSSVETLYFYKKLVIFSLLIYSLYVILYRFF